MRDRRRDRAADRAEVADALRAERFGLGSWLAELDDADWSTASLCDGWDVHDVVAHLTLATETSMLDFVRGMLRHRGDFDRMEAERARVRAGELAPAELVSQLVASAESTATSFASTPADSLVDVIVHAQDIARPLGRVLSPPPARAALALDRVMTSRWYGAKQRLGHATVRATDVDREWGDGEQEVQGPAIELLLVATGRGNALPALSGTGLPRLRSALS